MKHIETTFTCDRCGDKEVRCGVAEHIPSLWQELRSGNADGKTYTYVDVNALICHPCVQSLRAWMEVGE